MRKVSVVTKLVLKCDAEGCNEEHLHEIYDSCEHIGRAYREAADLGWVIGTAENRALCPKHRAFAWRLDNENP